MRLEELFTPEELALIDSGEYKPGRDVLDAKLDLCAAIEREACAQKFDGPVWSYDYREIAAAIRARSNT